MWLHASCPLAQYGTSDPVWVRPGGPRFLLSRHTSAPGRLFSGTLLHVGDPRGASRLSTGWRYAASVPPLCPQKFPQLLLTGSADSKIIRPVHFEWDRQKVCLPFKWNRSNICISSGVSGYWIKAKELCSLNTSPEPPPPPTLATTHRLPLHRRSVLASLKSQPTMKRLLQTISIVFVSHYPPKCCGLNSATCLLNLCKSAMKPTPPSVLFSKHNNVIFFLQHLNCKWTMNRLLLLLLLLLGGGKARGHKLKKSLSGA